MDMVEIAVDRTKRNRHVQELYSAMREALERRTSAEWLETCERLDIPATRLYALDQLPDHPHLVATDFFQTHDHPKVGTIRLTRPPTRFHRTPADIRRHAPTLGEQSREILHEAGLSDSEIDPLVASGFVRET